nr:MAG TPA: hypothetical protein [Caudoviricetes sp.]
MKNIIESILNKKISTNNELVEKIIQKYIKGIEEYQYEDGNLIIGSNRDVELYMDFSGLNEFCKTITFEGNVWINVYISGGNPQGIDFQNTTSEYITSIHLNSNTQFKNCTFSDNINFNLDYIHPYFDENNEMDGNTLKSLASSINNIINNNQCSDKNWFTIDYDYSSSGTNWKSNVIEKEFKDRLIPLLKGKSKKWIKNISLIV